MDPQELLELALDSGPIGTFRWNPSSGELIWNRHHFLIMGIEPGQPPTYELFRERVHPEDIDGLEANVEHAKLSRIRHSYRFRVLWPDGSTHHVQGCGFFSYDAQGNPEWMTGVITDVTKAHLAQQELERQERQLASLLEHSPDLYVRMDCNLRHLYVSPKITEFTGRPPSDFIGKTNEELGMPPHLCALWASAMRKVIDEKRPGAVQFEFPAPSGSMFFESRLMPEFDRDGEVESLLCITSDVTQHEEMLRTVQLSERRLRQADKTKDEFLATLAHELKTPLNAISAGIEILQVSDCSEHAQQMLALMERQTDHLCELVVELLDVSSIVQQKANFKWSTVDLREVARDAVALCKAEVEQAVHQLTVDLPDEPVLVSGDRRRLLQILVNLLINAVKYTPPRGKLLLALASGATQAEIRVSDNGIGIPEERMSQLFDIFFQAHPGERGTARGLGIGLAVVKRLVEMHRGSIEIRSDAGGGGTTVELRFPLLGSDVGDPTLDPSAEQL